MALSIGGSASGSASGTSCTSGNFDATPGVGQKVYVGVGWFDDTPRGVTITDNASGGSNSYSACGSKIKGGGSSEAVQWFSASVVTTNTPFTVTATFDGDAGAIRLAGIEIKGGPGATDLYGGQFQATPGTGTDAISTGALGTPGDAGCAVLAMCRSSSFPDTLDPGTGYTGLIDINAVNRTRYEYLIQTSAAGVTATFSQTGLNADTTSVAIAVAPSGGGGGSTAPDDGFAFLAQSYSPPARRTVFA